MSALQTLVLIAAVLFVIAGIVVIGFIIYDYAVDRSIDALPIVAAIALVAIGIGIGYFGSKYVS